jgi:hypothetical protein
MYILCARGDMSVLKVLMDSEDMMLGTFLVQSRGHFAWTEQSFVRTKVLRFGTIEIIL